MSEVKTTQEVTFDVIKTLILIGANEDLLSVYKEKYGTDIKLAIASAKKDLFKDGAERYVKGIFESIILKRKELLDQYVGVTTPKKVTIPKWYGKVEILKDVEDNGGKISEPQRMMLKVNDLKNVYAKLNRKGIKALFAGGEISDKECRDIIASIETIENKLKKIL